MPINGYSGGSADNVINTGAWADQSGGAYGYINGVGGANSYNFGPVINHYGTWGQLIYTTQQSLYPADIGALNGLNGYMPANPSPDNSNWVQGHLINAQAGGYGSIARNLAPISNNLNQLERGNEAVVLRLINRGALDGSAIISFNPHAIANTRLIYRAQGLPAPAGIAPGPVFPNVPRGLALSLGFVINNVMQTEAQVTHEFATGGSVNPRWFADRYYAGGDCAGDQTIILQLLGGVDFVYP